MIFQPKPVRTLIGAKGFDLSLTCLQSVFEYSADPIRFVFHEDGTLTDEHRAKLSAIAPGAEFVERRRADETVESILSRYPRCLAARRSRLMFLKLFDVCLIERAPLSYTDSDILFLRRYTGLFREPVGGLPVFMTDLAHAYAVRPWQVWPFAPYRLAGRLNAGLIVGWSHGLDLDFLEWLLGRLAQGPAFERRTLWVEQTCWAALAARVGCDLIDPKQIFIATETMGGYNPNTVAIHFVSPSRGRLAEFAGKRSSPTEPAVAVLVGKAGRITAAGMLWCDLRRRFVYLTTGQRY